MKTSILVIRDEKEEEFKFFFLFFERGWDAGAAEGMCRGLWAPKERRAKRRAETGAKAELEKGWGLVEWGRGRGWELTRDTRVPGICWQEVKGQVGWVNQVLWLANGLNLLNVFFSLIDWVDFESETKQKRRKKRKGDKLSEDGFLIMSRVKYSTEVKPVESTKIIDQSENVKKKR